MELFNLFDGAAAEEAGNPPGFRHRRTMLGPLLGASAIGGSLYELPPGERTWPYHYELNREEWALVVAGEPTLREPEGERRLRPGDVVCFPVGPDGAHALGNDTDETVRLLVLSDFSGDAYAGVQPDSDKLVLRGADGRRIVRASPQLDYWDGEA